MQIFCKLLLVVLYINAFQYTNSTLIDNLERNGLLNDRKHPRKIISGKIMSDEGLQLGENGYLYETIAYFTDPVNLQDKSFRMIYSSTKCRSCQLTAGLPTEDNSPVSQELYFTIYEGDKNEIVIGFNEFDCAHFYASEIVIRADHITIHQIYIIDDNEINWAEIRNQPAFPSTSAPNIQGSAILPAPNIQGSAILLDDFKQWENPTNVLEGRRIIGSTNLQHRGHAFLRLATEYLIEYLPNEHATRNYSVLRIIYSTGNYNSGPLFKNRVGMVLRADDQNITSFFFDWKFQRGNRVKLNISFKFIIQVMHKLRIGGNLGIIIRGPIKIHRIKFLTSNNGKNDIPFQIPAANVNISELVKNRRLFTKLHNTIPVFTASNVIDLDTVLDDFRQWENPTNVLEGRRIIGSTNLQHRGHAFLRLATEYLIEYLPNEHTTRNYSVLRITYSTGNFNSGNLFKNRVGIVLRADDQTITSLYFGWKFQRGNRVKLNISFKFIIQVMHKLRIGGNLGIIIRGPLKIHRIEFLTANNGENDIPFQIPAANVNISELVKNRRLFTKLHTIPVITATNVIDVLDDFRQWEKPTNVFNGDRRITLRDQQCQGCAILTTAKDYLMEYFHTDLSIKNYSMLCIEYSTNTQNVNKVLKEQIGIILRSNDKQQHWFFFNTQLPKGQKVRKFIPMKQVIDICPTFQINGNYGIIIRGPLTIHRIYLLPGEIQQTVSMNHNQARSTLIDGLERNSKVNDREHSRKFVSGKSKSGVLIDLQLGKYGYLYGTIADDTDPMDLQDKAIKMIYTSTKRSPCRLAAGLRTEMNRRLPRKLMFNVNKGDRNEVVVYFNDFYSAHVLASQIAIVAGQITIHRIDIIDDDEITWPEIYHQHIFPSSFAPNKIVSADLLDDFKQWENPTNVLGGDRKIVSGIPQRQGAVLLRFARDYLMEFFYTDPANMEYSALLISYSTSKWNTAVPRNKFGMVRRFNGVVLRPYMFNLELERKRNVKLRIPMKTFIKIWPNFKFNGDYGIIIIGPLIIHRIDLLPGKLKQKVNVINDQAYYQSNSPVDDQALDNSEPKMDDQAQPDSEINANVIDTHPFMSEYVAPEQLMFEGRHQALDGVVSEMDTHFSVSNNISLADWPDITFPLPNNLPLTFKQKYTLVRSALTRLMVQEPFRLYLKESDVLKGSIRAMQIRSFRMNLFININNASTDKQSYFNMLQKEIMADENQLFEQAGNMLYRIVPKRNVGPGVLDYYRFVGQVMGMGIMNNLIQHTKYVRMVYMILLNQPIPHTELVHTYPTLIKDIEQTLELSGSDLGLLAMSIRNTRPSTPIDVIQDLVFNSRNPVVDAQSKDEYVSALLQQYVQLLIGAQAEALRNGLYDVIPKRILAVFDEYELEQILMGLPDVMPIL